MVINVMLDLETWGTEPGCDIRSIGACVFNPKSRVLDPDPHTDIFYLATIFGDEIGLTRNPQTVQWWADQSPEAKGAFIDPIDIITALKEFTLWLNGLCGTGEGLPEGGHKNLRIWAHGSHFDIPILAAAYDACGLAMPWHYRSPRDTRTIFDAAGIVDHTGWLIDHIDPGAVKHHALHDAICQAEAVIGAYRRIRYDNFNAGYLIALSNLLSVEGRSTRTDELWAIKSNVKLEDIERLNLSEYDINNLTKAGYLK